MFKKTCSNCSKSSFSAAGKGKWFCPYCNKELTAEKFSPMNSIDTGRCNKGKGHEKSKKRGEAEHE